MARPGRPVIVDEIPFFDAFLSYSSRDRALVESLARRLAEDGFEVFFDGWFIAPGHDIPKVLLAALRKSRIVIACMTSSYFHSKWTEFELNWNFVESHLAPAGADPRLIPVMLSECDLPAQLVTRRRVNLTGDARDGGYGELASALSNPASLVVEPYRVPPGPRSRFFGDFVAAKLKQLLAFPEARREQFRIVYGELVQNAFDHGGRTSEPVEAAIRADRDQVTIEVTDAGAGFDLRGHLQAAREARSSDPSLAGLRGVQLVAELSDRLDNEMRHGRHVVTAVLYREPTTKEAASVADLLASPPGQEGSAWREESRGPWFVRFVDPAGRYVYLGIKVDRVDQHNAEALSRFRTESLARPFGKVIVDCSDVQYVSSAGLRELMSLARQVRATGGTSVLVVPKGPLAEIVNISRFELFFQVCRSLEEALRTLA